MRLAIVSRDVPPRVSGIGDYADLLAHELAARGHEVVVLCCPPADARTKIDVRPVIPAFNAKSIPAIDAALAGARPDAILWQYNPFSIGSKGVGPSAGRIARTMAKHAPLILVGHELWFPWAREGARGLVWAIAQRLETAAVFKASAHVVVTTESRERIVRKWFRKTPLSLVPIGANIEPDPTHAGDDVRERYGFGDASFVIAHVGSAGAGRDLRPVFESLRRLRAEAIEARLLLIGRGGSADVPYGLEGSVVSTGVLHANDVSEALRASDAYVFCEPSGPEAGRKGSLLAAFAHGLPVVAFDGPDRDSALRNGDNLLLVEPHAGTVTRALRSLAQDPSLRARIGAHARKLYDERFSWPVVGAKLEEILTHLEPR